MAKRSKAGDLIRQPHWRGLRLAAEDALVDERITVQGSLVRHDAMVRWHIGSVVNAGQPCYTVSG
ncbi:hypothetical protein [Amaricoccus sp.]|uniref:hypothetical protein n=1 Tax=Amaricoccus sp. TaxID=1872485 RepID=UPI002610EF3F|nr:hypothetical protein [Amaricoccus sp.]HRO13180.1 hypothetical protein [Amaricoccus sp.]